MKQIYLYDLIETILKLEDGRQALDFLKGILTPKELSEVVMRLQVVSRLKKGDSQRKIAQELGIGIATVSRGSREIQQGRFEYI